jgi:hypothetical protein
LKKKKKKKRKRKRKKTRSLSKKLEGSAILPPLRSPPKRVELFSPDLPLNLQPVSEPDDSDSDSDDFDDPYR